MMHPFFFGQQVVVDGVMDAIVIGFSYKVSHKLDYIQVQVSWWLNGKCEDAWFDLSRVKAKPGGLG